jgi:uncharacterized protein YbjQ (UPF0145 family)
MFEIVVPIGVPAVLLIVGYFAGRYNERRHYESIRAREERFASVPVVTWDTLEDRSRIVQAQLVTGSVVVSPDYFKRFAAALRTFVGGEIASYSSLLDRARREAVLRMKESLIGVDAWVNLRMETSTISNTSANRNKAVGGVEVVAYATAVRYRK